MNAITLQNRTIHAVPNKKSILSKFREAFRENHASVICGMMMLNGYSNVYPLYQTLSKR